MKFLFVKKSKIKENLTQASELAYLWWDEPRLKKKQKKKSYQ